MVLRTTFLRQCRLLQTSQRQIIRPVLIRNSISQRPFHYYPLQRFADSSSNTSNSTSAEEATSAEQSTAETNSGEQTTEPPKPASDPAPSPKQDAPPPPKREVDPKDHELAALKDKYLRSVAEFRNLQLQTRREVNAAQAFTIQRFSTDLLDTIDTLTTALESCPPLPPLETTDPNQKEDVLVTEHRNLHEGLRMVEHILLKTLERHGITPIKTETEVLPGFHEVVREVEAEGKEVGTIAQVLQRGYTLNGKILRPAKITVVKAKSAEPEKQ